MFVRKIAFFFVGLFGLLLGTASAQSEARVRVVVPNVQEVEDDLQWLFELSPTPELRKQWANFKEVFLDAFTQGVDKKQPGSVDLIFRKDELAYEFRIPVEVLVDKKVGFLESLKGIGYTKQTKINEGFYELSERNKKPFYLRYDKASKYAWIYGLQNAVPANPPPAINDLLPLLNLKKDVVGELKNDAAGLAARRTNFKELRTQFEALVKQKRNEDLKVFELRKLLTKNNLNEVERFLVESEQLLVTWNTDKSVGLGRGELTLTALPGTELLKSIQEFAIKPSHFANVTLHDNPILSGKMTFPIDDSRVAHLKEYYKSIRPVLEAKIKESKDADAQKSATSKAMNIFIDMLDESLPVKLLDGFIDCHAVAPKKNVLVCGIQSVNGKTADGIVKLITGMQDGWKVSLDAHEYGGVKIHEITVPASLVDSYQALFAGQTLFYVGTSKNVVWGAAGDDSLTYLKAAIDQTAMPAPEKVDPVVISYHLQVAKLERLMEVIQKEAPVGTDKEQQKRRKDLEKYRKLAQDAMAGCDPLISGELRRTENKIEGFLELNHCVLKYVGSMIADGAKQLQ